MIRSKLFPHAKFPLYTVAGISPYPLRTRMARALARHRPGRQEGRTLPGFEFAAFLTGRRSARTDFRRVGPAIGDGVSELGCV